MSLCIFSLLAANTLEEHRFLCLLFSRTSLHSKKRSPLLIPSRTIRDEVWILLQHKQLSSQQFGIKAQGFRSVRLKLPKKFELSVRSVCHSTCPPIQISTLPLKMLQEEWCRTAGKKKKIYIYISLGKLSGYQHRDSAHRNANHTFTPE